MTSGKNPVLAAFLSFLLPGLGQFYAGVNGKGVMFIIIDIILAVIGSTIVGLIFSIPAFIAVWIWSIIAAARACAPKLTAPQYPPPTYMPPPPLR